MSGIKSCLSMRYPILARVDILCALWGGCTGTTWLGRDGSGLLGGVEEEGDTVGPAKDPSGWVGIGSEADAGSGGRSEAEDEETGAVVEGDSVRGTVEQVCGLHVAAGDAGAEIGWATERHGQVEMVGGGTRWVGLDPRDPRR